MFDFLFVLTATRLDGSPANVFKLRSRHADFPELESSGKKMWNNHFELSLFKLVSQSSFEAF